MAALERLSPPLAKVLERRREHFNARYAQVAMFNRRLDPQQWAEHLLTVIDPLVLSVEVVAKDQVEAVTEVLYDLSLELLAADLLARYPAIRRAWVEILPQVPRFLATAPQRVVSAISNAAFNVAKEQPEAAEAWLDDMLAIAPLCEQADTFLEAGKVLAWRCGLAHYRLSAIDAWLDLPVDLATQVLPEVALGENRQELVDGLRRPWVESTPNERGQNLNLVMQVGAFRGFEGQFISPPQVATDLDQLFVHDQQTWWTLHADRYGSTLKRLGSNQPTGLVEQSGKFAIGDAQVVGRKSISTQFPELVGAASMACDGETLAVTLPHSHTVFLLARGTALLAFESS